MTRLDPFLEAILARTEQEQAAAQAAKGEPPPWWGAGGRPTAVTQLFNIRLTGHQLGALRAEADRRRLPVSAMARAWLMERLEQEQADESHGDRKT